MSPKVAGGGIRKLPSSSWLSPAWLVTHHKQIFANDIIKIFQITDLITTNFRQWEEDQLGQPDCVSREEG